MHAVSTTTTTAQTRVAGLPTWAPQVAVGAAGLAACCVLTVRDPNVAGSYGVCPFLALTGHDCPGCGLMRGTHAALNGDVEAAVDHNVFTPLVLMLIAFAYVRWLSRGLGREPRPVQVPSWLPVGLGLLIALFWLVRNLGGPFEYLAAAG